MDMKDMTPERKFEILWHSLDHWFLRTPNEVQETDEDYISLFDVLEETATLESYGQLKEALKVLEKEFSKWLENERFKRLFENGILEERVWQHY